MVHGFHGVHCYANLSLHITLTCTGSCKWKPKHLQFNQQGLVTDSQRGLCSHPRRCGEWWVIDKTQWCRRRGCRCTPKSFDLVKIRAKSVKTFAKYLKIWTKLAPNVCRCTWRPAFFGGHPGRRSFEKCLHKKCSKSFGQVWGNWGKNPFHPQKFCLLLHLWWNINADQSNAELITSGLSSNVLMSSRAHSTFSSLGLKHFWTTGICPGWIICLPVNPILAPSRACFFSPASSETMRVICNFLYKRKHRQRTF